MLENFFTELTLKTFEGGQIVTGTSLASSHFVFENFKYFICTSLYLFAPAWRFTYSHQSIGVCMGAHARKRMYSYLSNKCQVKLTVFKKKSTHQAQLHHPRLLISQIYSTLHSWLIAFMNQFFFQKIPPSMFSPTSTYIDFATFATPPRLFQPPTAIREMTMYVQYERR